MSRWVGWLTAVNLVVLSGTVVLVSQVRDDAKAGADSAAVAATAAEDIQGYVEELRTVTPEEAERNAAISDVLSSVPGIAQDTDATVAILCTAFPQATACPDP